MLNFDKAGTYRIVETIVPKSVDIVAVAVDECRFSRKTVLFPIGN
jgi:hypothetical protein